MWIGINIWLIIRFFSLDIAEKPWLIFVLVQLFLMFCWGPGVYLYLTYLKKNYKSKLEYDCESRMFKYSKGSQLKTFRIKDIDESFVWKAYAFIAPWSNFNYLRIDLKGGDSIWITCLLADVDQLVNTTKLKVQNREGVIPSL